MADFSRLPSYLFACPWRTLAAASPMDMDGAMINSPSVGFIGVGLMGHGIAKNLIERGRFRLTVLGNRNRAPVEDLVRRGAKEAQSAADVARASDVIFLCLPSSTEVEAIVYGAEGLMTAMKSGTTIVDTTTADPSITRRIGADLATRGVTMLDAALGRTPREAEEGKLSTYVGGEAHVLESLRSMMASYADTIVYCGPLGAGATCKLINNSISIGMATLMSESLATAAKSGVNLAALCDVLSAGAVDGRMWQMMAPWICRGDDSHLKAPIRIVAKDLNAYAQIAEESGAAIPIARAVRQTLQLAVNLGHEDEFLPILPGILAALNGATIQPSAIS